MKISLDTIARLVEKLGAVRNSQVSFSSIKHKVSFAIHSSALCIVFIERFDVPQAPEMCFIVCINSLQKRMTFSRLISLVIRSSSCSIPFLFSLPRIRRLSWFFNRMSMLFSLSFASYSCTSKKHNHFAHFVRRFSLLPLKPHRLIKEQVFHLYPNREKELMKQRNPIDFRRHHSAIISKTSKNKRNRQHKTEFLYKRSY